MFKALGAFIDEVGSLTGRAIKEMLSDKDNEHEIDGLTGDIDPDINIEESEHVVITGIYDRSDKDNTIFLDD